MTSDAQNMIISFHPDLIINRIDNLFGRRKKPDAKILWIVTDVARDAVIFTCGARSLGIEAEIMSGGSVALDALSSRDVFRVITGLSRVSIITTDDKVTIRQGGFIVNLNRLILKSPGSEDAISVDRRKFLLDERRRLQIALKKIDEELVSCRIIRKNYRPF